MDRELSREAKARLRWMDHFHNQGRNAALTCRYYGISRQTFYRWARRYDPTDLSTLEDRSHRPRRVRNPTWTTEEIQAVRRIRKKYPRWGKDKLAVLLRRDGVEMSVSRVGRIVAHLKRRGDLIEPPRKGRAAKKKPPPRPWATRKPKDYVPKQPGDLVEVDTLDVTTGGRRSLKHFTARDVISRWDVVEAHRRATAPTAAGFLDTLEERMPFPIRAIQVDGGPEFRGEFEAECQRRGILLFELPPRSPKLNGAVERAQRTHTEEFYEITDFPTQIAPLNQILRNWEDVYNTVRPHQALRYLTPRQFLDVWRNDGNRTECH
jgi:transposase InsO family protein